MSQTNKNGDAAAPSSDDANDLETSRLKQGIEKTRAEMTATMTALETRLNPSEIREKVEVELQHVEDRVRMVVREQLAEAKSLVQNELLEAKNLLREEMNEAEQKVKRGLTEARDSVKRDLRDALTSAKQAVRAATLGRVEDLATTIGDKMNNTRETLVDTIRKNPVPAAVMGVGLVWLLMNRSKGASRRTSQGEHSDDARSSGKGGESAWGDARNAGGHMVERVGAKVGEAAHRATEATGKLLHEASHAAGDALTGASDLASRVAKGTSETATALTRDAGNAASQIVQQAAVGTTYIAHEARQTAQRIEDGFRTTLQDNPLALVAAALALGAVVGFSLPGTNIENGLMGETRDRVFQRASDAALEAASTISHLTDQTAENARKSLKETINA